MNERRNPSDRQLACLEWIDAGRSKL